MRALKAVLAGCVAFVSVGLVVMAVLPEGHADYLPFAAQNPTITATLTETPSATPTATETRRPEPPSPPSATPTVQPTNTNTPVPTHTVQPTATPTRRG